MAKFKLIQTKEFIKGFKNLLPNDKDKVKTLLKLLENGEELPSKFTAINVGSHNQIFGSK